MEEQTSGAVEFTGKLLELNRLLVAVFNSGDVELFTPMNQVIKEMHAIQHGSEEPALQAVDEDCVMIYENFDMIIKVLRTTENGVIDRAAQTAINKFLHNIHEASVNIASAYGLIGE